MTSIDIYSILTSKSHNLHHLKRYIKFIEVCRESNKSIDKEIPTEEHHIAPKASDLFPEYSNLKSNPWNNAVLTTRQHILAHVILWKTFGGSQTIALDLMINRFNSSTNRDLQHRKIPTSIQIRYATKLRDLSKHSTVFKDSNGLKYYLNVDDSKIQELNLVGHCKDVPKSEEHKKLISEAHKGNSRYKDEFGQKYYLSVNDPLIKNLGLVGSNKGIKYDEEHLRICQDAANLRIGSKMWNNGLINKLININDKIPEGWVEGSLPNKIRKSPVYKEKPGQQLIGTIYWNNGIINIRVKEGVDLSEEWIKGSLPQGARRPNKVPNAHKGKILWNDGTRIKYYEKNEIPEKPWTKGALPKPP